MSEGTVYVTTRDNGGSHPKLHTDPNCRGLRDTDTVEPKPRDAYPDDAKICRFCQGEVETPDSNDMSAYHALRNAGKNV